ncbi:hypothetical protein [Kitasatospora brasiliensis]|uniref:hypothetical protein n=1 Tax=Kitasatospora brasiliensis TaxID=3058040 RepID=UPI00292DAD50|nr:hypothetical protein [Kitasatospora sp. K002]
MAFMAVVREVDDGDFGGGEVLGDVEDPEGFEEFAGVGFAVGFGVGEEGVVAVGEAGGDVGGRDVEGGADGVGDGGGWWPRRVRRA